MAAKKVKSKGAAPRKPREVLVSIMKVGKWGATMEIVAFREVPKKKGK